MQQLAPQIYTALTGRAWHPLWNPLPGKQTDAYESLADEVYYGGSGGGGKTDLALGLALTSHQKTLFLRRESTQLIAAVERCQKIAGRHGRWKSIGPHGGIMRLADGRSIEFAGCDQESDKENYRGRDHDLKIFDEAPLFSRSQVRFISAWNRSTDQKQRCRILLPGNPPSKPEDRWIIEEFAPWLDQHFPDPALPGELRWYSTVDGKTKWFRTGDPVRHEGETLLPRSRTFIPARLRDNPILAATGYESVLQSLPEPLRSQVLYGDMNAGVNDDDWQVIPTEWVRMAQARWRPGPPEGFKLDALGVDVARGGADKTCISKRFGYWFAPLIKIPGSATPDGPLAADRVRAVYADEAMVNIDVIGIGASAYDCLRSMYGTKVVGVNNAEATDWQDRTKRLKFMNVRAASYWAMREALDPSGPEKLALPPDQELLADLCAARYRPMTSGIKIESKEDIIKRIGRSPDAGDALVLSNWRVKLKQAWIL